MEQFLEDKGIFYNDSNSNSETYDNESSSDGDDEQEEVYESFNNNSLKIVSPLLLQELTKDFAVCKHCGAKLLLCEDVVSSHSFGRMWKFECETDSCESNKLTYRSITPKRSHFFEINRAAVLVFRLIGKGHSGAKKVASILNIDKPINLHSRKRHTESISLQCEKLLDEKLKEEALNAKLYFQNTGQLSNLENAINQNIDISTSIDESWNSLVI